MACSLDNVKLDADDPFDNIVFLEHRFAQDGYNEGYNKGQITGIEEGFKLGVQRGKVLGDELGFYKGFCDTILAYYNDNGRNTRILRLLEKLSYELGHIVVDDAKSQDLFDDIDRIRNRFKMVTAVLKIKLSFGDTKQEDISF